MPELPEVETIKRQLAPLVEGRKLMRMEILDARWCRPLAPRELVDALVGRRVEQLGRRGKYLLWSFDDEVYLAQHLRMTGSVLYQPDPEPLHTRARMELGAKRPARSGGVRSARSGGVRLAIADPRRFGTGELLLGFDAMQAFFDARLGLEPLDEGFTGAYLRALARGRQAPIKAFLLDQRRIAGVGNIYADEALYRAGIHPLRPAGRLTAAQYERLRETVIESLNAGIEARGATIDDFRHVDGVRGSFQNQFLVHLRANEPCGRCGTTIVKMVAAGRGTYVCETCQPRPRATRRPTARQR
ncbi:MAG TPA: bifunctional DNA-formamidopyrimidine glycosylase/DNA-(apurinic or apyrimidinic site) lyase [Solirubrobacteraceae bacterium]|nr:bifunctional DNA-formamidopyrimidine glycosylase/DNA-(apurinic or apyrimidinic site) lyase [Solirubrobacteraceae bacterium]